MMKNYFNYNGKLLELSDPALSLTNHSYRYGDGLFETMKMVNGKIELQVFHLERLFYSMEVLGFRVPAFFSENKIAGEIELLANKNNCTALARVRLLVSRGNGGVNDCDDHLQYTIECMPADAASNRLNENGLIVDIFPDARKSCDAFSSLKSSSYLHYIMAARFAKEHKLNDAFILNQFDRICEATITNLFWIKNKTIFTTPLSEGCVAGVMRRYLLEKISSSEGAIQEKPATIDELENADELFLTNAVNGMRWVKQFRAKQYGKNISTEIYQSFIAPLWK